jgi:hypothetical protein
LKASQAARIDAPTSGINRSSGMGAGSASDTGASPMAVRVST